MTDRTTVSAMLTTRNVHSARFRCHFIAKQGSHQFNYNINKCNNNVHHSITKNNNYAIKMYKNYFIATIAISSRELWDMIQQQRSIDIIVCIHIRYIKCVTENLPANQMLAMRVLVNAFSDLPGEMLVLAARESVTHAIICLNQLNNNTQVSNKLITPCKFVQLC